jgi:hypothetical protein
LYKIKAPHALNAWAARYIALLIVMVMISEPVPEPFHNRVAAIHEGSPPASLLFNIHDCRLVIKIVLTSYLYMGHGPEYVFKFGIVFDEKHMACNQGAFA